MSYCGGGGVVGCGSERLLSPNPTTVMVVLLLEVNVELSTVGEVSRYRGFIKNFQAIKGSSPIKLVVIECDSKPGLLTVGRTSLWRAATQ